MPLGTIIVLAAIVVPFVVFAVVLEWVERLTNPKTAKASREAQLLRTLRAPSAGRERTPTGRLETART